jgi:hypothetical protein
MADLEQHRRALVAIGLQNVTFGMTLARHCSAAIAPAAV